MLHDADTISNTRTPEIVRAKGNRLKGEQSLYLRQHAHNPVDWYPWGEEALAKARDEDKPVFLSIGYSSCHWCHVMEREVFEDDEVASYLNEHFVPIKVDREERPDLDAVYMEAAVLMSGSGGWPLSMFLTPHLKPFYCATYLPQAQFLALAQQVAHAHREERGKLDQAACQMQELLGRELPTGGRAMVSEAALCELAAQAVHYFDARYGGFKGQQKFPLPSRLSFLLHSYRKCADSRLGQMLRLTLDQMAAGGIYDQVGGGFHRYSVDPAWTVPHFEKMLYDNAQLARLYAEAAAVFNAPRYGQVARETLGFLLREMQNPDGGFYASFDADSDGEEGSYYIWTPAELKDIAGDDAEPLAALLGVTEQGNFDGANVLTRRLAPDEVEQRCGLSWEEAQALLKRWLPALREYRAKRAAPVLDRKIVTAWNGLAIEALATGYLRFGEEHYLKAAERAADYLWHTHRAGDGTLYRASTDGVATAPGILDDYADLAAGLLMLYQASGDAVQLKHALELLDVARQRFAKPGGGYFLTAEGAEAPLGRQVELHDGVEPSGNSALLKALLMAAALTGREEYYDAVEESLAAYAEHMLKTSLGMAGWLDAALLDHGPYYAVVIAGDRANARTAELIAACGQKLPPQVVLARLPAAGIDGELAKLAPALAGKHAPEGVPVAYICQRGSCLAPVSDPAELKSQLFSAWVY